MKEKIKKVHLRINHKNIITNRNKKRQQEQGRVFFRRGLAPGWIAAWISVRTVETLTNCKQLKSWGKDRRGRGLFAQGSRR